MRSQWEAFYTKPNPWGSELGIEDIVRTNTLVGRVQHANFRHALDLGCGEGVLTNELSKISEQIVAYDISDIALNRARHRFPHIEFRQGDIFEVIQRPDVLAEPFDFISVAEMLFYTQTDEKRREAVRGLAQLGAPNCLFFISVVVNSSTKHRRFSHEKCLALLSEHFRVIESFPSIAAQSEVFRLMQFLTPTRSLRLRLIEAWTKLHEPKGCSAGYLAMKRRFWKDPSCHHKFGIPIQRGA